MPAERAYVPDMSLMTAEELLRTSMPNKRTELVRGRLVVREPAGWRHGEVTMNLAARLTGRACQPVPHNLLKTAGEEARTDWPKIARRPRRSIK